MWSLSMTEKKNKNEFKITTNIEDSLQNIATSCEDLNWGCAMCLAGESELVTGMIVGHDAYIDLILEYLPDDFEEKLNKLYDAMVYVHEETETKH